MKSRILHSSLFQTSEGSEPDESVLLGRAKRGDTRAFEKPYRAHVGRVYLLCLRLSGTVERAEEFTQSAFVQAWKKLDTCRGESGFFPWLHRLATNVVLQENRARQRREMMVVTVEDPEVFGGVQTVGPEVKIDLERAVAALPEGARVVLVLHDIEGYTHSEIAEMTGTAEGTCKAQLHRARRLLREAIER